MSILGGALGWFVVMGAIAGAGCGFVVDEPRVSGATSGAASATGSGGSGPIGAGTGGAAPADFGADFKDAKGSAVGTMIAVAPDGRVALAGAFASAIDFGSGALVDDGGTGDSMFLATFDANGAGIWSKRFTGSTGLYGGLAFDPDGNVVVATIADQGDLDFGAGALPSTGGSDIAVAKFDAAGSLLFGERFGNGGNQLPSAVAVDASGNIVVVGSFQGVLDFGAGGSIDETDGDESDVFVLELDPGGHPLWSRNVGSDADVWVAVGPDGGVVLAGQFYGKIAVGPSVLTSTGPLTNVFVAALDPGGNGLWSRRFGDGTAQSLVSVAVDASGVIGLAGSFQGVIDFGAGPLQGGSQGFFVAQLDPGGGTLWAQAFGDAGTKLATDPHVGFSSAGDLVVAGTFLGDLGLGGPALTSDGSALFIGSFDAHGAQLGSRSFGGSATGSALDVYGGAVTPSGEAWVTGDFFGKLVVGPDVLLADTDGTFTDDDVFLARVAP